MLGRETARCEDLLELAVEEQRHVHCGVRGGGVPCAELVEFEVGEEVETLHRVPRVLAPPDGRGVAGVDLRDERERARCSGSFCATVLAAGRRHSRVA